MHFAAKLAAPLAATHGVRLPVIERAADGARTFFTAPAGYFPAASLRAALDERGRPSFWLRLGPDDQDPAQLALDLLAGARRLNREAGQATLDLMRRQPGPISGWPPVFHSLAAELGCALPPDTVIVIEHLHYLVAAGPALALLERCLLTDLPEHVGCILTSDSGVPLMTMRPNPAPIGCEGLRLDQPAARRWLAQGPAELAARPLHKALRLAHGRSAILAALAEAGAQLGPGCLQSIIDRAGTDDDLLQRIAQTWLSACEADALTALALAARLEYSHPDLEVGAAPPAGPWFQTLADDWRRVRRCWLGPLRAALGARARLTNEALRQAAVQLCRLGAVDQAVQASLEAGDFQQTAQVISSAADELLDQGGWWTLERWLGALPPAARRLSPTLVHAEAELAAAQGQAEAGYQAFALAAELFLAQGQPAGACLSLLAESTLAAWHGRSTHAQTQAISAAVVADAHNLPQQHSWAVWQLGCLAVAAGDLDGALAYFNQAATLAAAAGDDSAADGLRRGEALARHWRDLQRQSEFHRQALAATERAEHKAAQRVQDLLTMPSRHLEVVLGAYGWSRTPLMLKLPVPVIQRPAPTAEVPAYTRWWQALLGWLSPRRAPPAWPAGDETAARPRFLPVPPLPNADSPFPSSNTAAWSVCPEAELGWAGGVEAEPTELMAPAGAQLSTAPASQPREAAQPETTPASGAAGPEAPPLVEARLLGQFQVTINGRPVAHWPKGKALGLFKYLILHHDQPALREVLMDVFWPEAGPESARNRLNVALHHLRQALRAVTEAPLIVFESGAYSLRPDLRLELDADDFERCVQQGHRHETAGQLDKAIAEYERALSLYHADLLTEDPYESWPVLARERLRVAHLDTLDRLGQIYFARGEYEACIIFGDQLLERDRCREDAHTRLMQCYSRTGRTTLALRQYQACAQALRTELDVEPAAATTALYEDLRQPGRRQPSRIAGGSVSSAVKRRDSAD